MAIKRHKPEEIVAKLRGNNHYMRRLPEFRESLSERMLALGDNHPFRSQKKDFTTSLQSLIIEIL